VRRELLSWQIEEWAHINPGSIYSSLSTLTKLGHLERHELSDGGRAVTVYTTTAEGRAQFERLFGESMERPDLLCPLPFHTALLLAPLVERERFAAHLAARIALGNRARAQAARGGPPPDGAPPHTAKVAELWDRIARVELEWLRDMLARVRAGEFDFRGERSRWSPPADDPGWQISAERERYRQLLGIT
jgi:DNA-binding PadR family transcriptional regulator